MTDWLGDEREQALEEHKRLLSQVEAERERWREEAHISDTLNRIGTLVAGELDLEKLVQAVTDTATNLSEAEFGAFFYTLISERGETYTLYTLSGAPKEAFAAFPQPRNTPLFGPTFRGEGIIRRADVTKDPRYGQIPPYHGMPPGHLPVRSYLAVPVVSRSGEVLGGLFLGHREPCVFTERSERLVSGVAAQAAVAIDNARLYGQAQQAIRIRDTFLASAAHELKTPVTTLQLGMEVAARKLRQGTQEDIEAGLRALDALVQQSKKLSQLLAQILDISRLEQAHLEIEQRPTHLAQLAQTVVENLQPSAPHHTLVLKAEPDVVALVDALKIEQVLVNLVNNAMAYSPAGSLVTVEVYRTADDARIAVTDQGNGIPEEHRAHIFERFYQVQPGRGLGLGLGLYISREIVSLHGGELFAEHPLEGGTRFIFTLPIE